MSQRRGEALVRPSEGAFVMTDMRSKAGSRARHGYPAWWLLAAATANGLGAGAGCLSDVPLSDCVREQRPCQEDGGAPPGAEDGGAGPELLRAGEGGAERDREAAAGAGGAESGIGAADAGGRVPEPFSFVDEPQNSRLNILPRALTAPCAGSAYHSTLHVVGGVGPYGWALTPPVAGWSIEPDSEHSELGVLSNAEVSADAVTLVVTASDADGNSKVVELPIAPRERCLVAYTALRDGEPGLFLLDPFQEPASPAALQNASGVFDFAFSPDGRYLAYRFGADASAPHGRHVSLVDLNTHDERVLSLGEDSITALAWSPDSSKLALGFTTSQGTFLTAALLPQPGASAGPTLLTATAAFVESDLSWVGEDFVAFQAEKYPDPADPQEFLPNPDRFHSAFYARLGPGGFGAPELSLGLFDPGVVLRATDAGFFMITGAVPGIQFTSLGDAPQTAPHFFSRIISPSGRYTAELDADTLQVMRANEGYFFPLAVADPGDACPTLLGWSSGVERLACVADVPNPDGTTSHGEVRFFELEVDGDEGSLPMSSLAGFCDDDTSTLSSGSCGQRADGYAYGSAESLGSARAFSGSGRWFVFARVEPDATYLNWADLKQDPPALARVEYLAQSHASTPTALAFSPDEHLLAFERGSVLWLLASNRARSFSVLSSDLDVSSTCSDDFPMAPDAYCGNTELLAPFEWAPTSQALAFRAQGHWLVDDLSSPSSPVEFALPGDACGQRCSGELAFQPHFGE